MNKSESKKKIPRKKKVTRSSGVYKEEDVTSSLKKYQESISNAEPNSDIEADFFCREPSAEKQSINSQQSSLQDTDPNTTETPTILLASAYVNIEETNPLSPVLKESVSKDSDLLYIPSDKNVVQADRIQINRRKNIEDDGLYNNGFLKLKTRNANRLVNRFLEEDFTGDPDSLVKVKDLSSDYVYKSYSEKVFHPIYFEPRPFNQVLRDQSGASAIVVHLKEIVFTEHPQFSEENEVAVKLSSTYKTYSKIVAANKIPKLSSELSALRNTFNNYLNSVKVDKKKLRHYSERIKKLRTELHADESTLKEATLNCIEIWKQLKSIRRKQGSSLTNIKLIIKLTEKDVEQAQKEWDRRFEIELNEIVRESFEVYSKNKKNASKGGKSAVKKPDIEDIRITLLKKFDKDLESPEEPNVILELTYSETKKKLLDNPKSYYVKLFLDKRPVCSTKMLKLNTDFVMNIDQIFAITIATSIPELIQFQIFDKSNILLDQKVAETDLFIPQSDSFKISKELEFFSTKASIRGCLKVDIYSKDENFDDNTLMSRLNSSSKKIISASTLIKNHQETREDTDLFKGSESTGNEKLPTSSASTGLSDDSEYFTFAEESLTFCSKADFDNNKRFKMLNARYRNDFKYKDKRFIPTSETEMEEESAKHTIENLERINPIDRDKHKGKKYLKTLYQLVLNHSEKLNKKEDADDLLVGDNPPTLSSIISALAGIFSSSRPLNPMKSGPSSIHAANCSNFNVIINVVRATGVPYRQFGPNSPASRRSSTTSLAYQVTKPSNVRPYISLFCKRKYLRTSTAEGSNPTWNEQLVLQINRAQLDSKDDITFELFDEYVEDLSDDDSARPLDVYQRIHANWLGELRFPLTTIISKMHVEGVFELETPQILLGYTKPSLGNRADIINVENVPEMKKTVYLNLSISVEPKFEVPITKMSHLECSELRELKSYIQETCIDVKEMFPDRFVDALVSIADGKRICMTRLIEPLPIPFDVDEETESVMRRYISLFPVYRTTSSCLGLHGVWFNNQIILDSSWASPKDLGVLLCCFYLSLDITAALVLGVAYPHGDAAFVLLKQTSEYMLIDPTSGRKYASSDSFCPLIKAYCVVREDNIFFNIQSETRVSFTDFDVGDTGNWYPIFSKKHPAPSGEFHKLNYQFRGLYEINDLQKAIERKIMRKINSWRPYKQTVWNRDFKETLYNVLIELERDALFEREESIYMERIMQTYPHYKIFGITRNFTYTNLSSVSERVRATGIHLNTDQNVEFGCAVYIQQYPNNILSVWMFIITATPSAS